MTVSELCANCGAQLSADAEDCPHCALTVADEWGKWRRRRSQFIATAEGDEVMAELSSVLAPSIEVVRPLGAGGMGLVYLGHDMVLKRLVAIKVLSPSFATEETARDRFTREVEAIAAITHPHVVSIYQVGELTKLGTPYFLMQYVEGTTLRSEVRPGEIVPEAKARRIVGEVAMALSAAHARGLVHRDIKPANIMLDRESGRALVVDFGISATVSGVRDAGRRLSVKGMFVGTPAYMSPEQASGEDITPASDIYSLGIVAFELLTGRLPFTGRSSMDIMAGHGSETAAPLIRTLRPELHPQLAELIDRSLRKAPEERPSADEIARLLFPVTRTWIEWPPPGLGQLRALGARLSQTLAVAEGTGLLFFLLLMLQPALASLKWYEDETSAFWNLVLTPNATLRAIFEGTSAELERPMVDATPIWAFLLTLSLVVMLVCVPFIIGRALHLAVRIRWARQSGYPWKVIFAVGWDYRRDTGDLLNGTGIYALLPRPERRRLVRLRWIEQLSGAAGILLGAVTPLLWFLSGPMRNTPRSGHLVSPNEALLVIAPPLLALLVLMICKRPEWRHRSRMLRQRVFTARGLPPLVRPELVASWLKTMRFAGPQPARTSRLWLAGVPIAMLLVATGIVAAIFISALPTFIATARSRGPAVDWVNSFASDSLRPLAWQEIEQAVAPFSPPRRSSSTPQDAEMARALLLRVAPLHDTPPDGNARSAPVELRIARILARPRLQLTDAEVTQLASDTLLPALAQWRRIAAVTPLPNAWYMDGRRIPLAHPLSPELPRRLRELAAINSGGALLAARDRDSAAVRRRIAENRALGMELLALPIPGTQTTALDILIETLAIERRITAPSASPAGSAPRAELIEETLMRARRERKFFETHRERLLMADPRSGVGVRFAGDSTLLPAERWSLVTASVTGFCHDAREILFGMDARRADLIERTASAMASIPGTDAWASMHREWLRDGLPLHDGGSRRAVRANGLRGFPGRLRFCWSGARETL